MNKIIPSIIEDNGEYYIHFEEYKTLKELGEHYKHLYSKVKKQKDDAVEYIKEHKHLNWYVESCYTDNLLRMLGEIDVED